jgi:phospholipid/cholesterol/gamma-HCH transport system permease protein
MQQMPFSLRAAVKEVQDISFLTTRAFVSAFRRPYYVRDTLFQMESIGVGSLPVVMMTGFFTGAVLSLQSANTLTRFGAAAQTGYAVSVSLVRELGPVIGSLMVAGRSGSGMASELGSMVVTEQVNAMRALGTDPVKKLVVPRVAATTFMMPILTIVADTMGILGGLLVSTLMLRISSNQYLSSAFDGLETADVVGGLLKPLFFGAIIALVGCHCGLRTYGGTQGVGRSTTQAVVNASVLILLFDFLLSRIILIYS